MLLLFSGGVGCYYQSMSLIFAEVLPVPIFLAWEWRYGHGTFFNVYRGILLVFYGLGVPLLSFKGARYRQSLSFLIFGKCRFDFELLAGQRALMFLFEHLASSTTGPKGPNPGPKHK